jgi:hypothetical protein
MVGQVVAVCLAVVMLATAATSLGLSASNLRLQTEDVKAWKEWEAFKGSPATAAAVQLAQGVRDGVADVVGRAAPGGGDTVLVGSYRNLSFQQRVSDVDVKVLLNVCADFNAVRQALITEGFTHMYTAASYALFRKIDVPTGLHVDVSVTARTTKVPDGVQCTADAARDLDLRGFLMRRVRTAMGDHNHDTHITVRHWVPKP